MGTIIIYGVIALTVAGVVLSLVLYLVAQKFKVIEDPRIDLVAEKLPGANCGGCGFAGCRALAEAIVKAENLDGKACPVGGAPVMAQVAEVMGLQAEESDPMIAVVRCNGGKCNTHKKVEYNGATDCFVANQNFAGEGGCSFGCLGLGNCTKACKFDAIHFIGNLNATAWVDMLWPHMSNAYGVTEEEGDIEVDVYQLSQLNHLYNADTAIHEQGHLFGLEDYYDYSYDTDYSFLGVADMQDQSYFDWNSFSKMTVGWANPYIINGERKSTTITLNANAIDGSCLVIPANFETWNGTPFDEYFLFELFTTEDEINSNYAKAYTHDWYFDHGEYGVKIYHVNGQLCGLDGNNNLEDKVDEPTKKYSYYRCACSNSGDKDSYICLDECKSYPLISAIGRTDSQRFTRTGIRPYRDVDLWQQGDVFTFEKAKYGLLKGGAEATAMNNGETWNYSVSFDEVTKTSMTVTVKQI